MHYRHKDVPKQFSDPKPLLKEKKPKTGLKRQGINSRPATLIEKLDRVFSRWRRKSLANQSGMVKCYTCDVWLHWTKIENGHFQKRKHMGTRWHIPNNNPQCPCCNGVKEGNLKIYAENLMKEYGKDILLELSVLATKETHFSKPELEEMIQEYTEKLALLK